MPSDAEEPRAELTVVGITNRTATAVVRDQLFVEDWQQANLLANLRRLGIHEAVVLSTCERTEVIAVLDDGNQANAIIAELAQIGQVDPPTLTSQGHRLRGAAALRHLLAIASSLESQVMGEPQILGQLKESHRQSAAQGMVGSALEDAMRLAYETAKRVRNETSIGQGPVTLATSAVQVATDLHGSLESRAGLLLGLGEMSEPLALAFAEAGIGHMTVTHPSAARAEAVARRLNGHFQSWSLLEENLVGADIVIAAEGAGSYTVSAALVEVALRRRRRQPMFFIDAGVPADVDPNVQALDGAFVYDLHDLEGVAQKGSATRRREAERAWTIVDEELERFSRRVAGRRAVPTLRALRRHFEQLRQEILLDTNLDAAAATRLLINRLLHEPSAALTRAAAEDEQRSDSLALEASSRRLFGLTASSGSGDDSEEESR